MSLMKDVWLEAAQPYVGRRISSTPPSGGTPSTLDGSPIDGQRDGRITTVHNCSLRRVAYPPPFYALLVFNFISPISTRFQGDSSKEGTLRLHMGTVSKNRRC